MKIVGTGSHYPVEPGKTPVKLSVSLHEPSEGVCFETAFDADDCGFFALDSTLTCVRR